MHKRALLNAVLEEMLQTSVAMRSQNPWAFSVLLAVKEDRKARSCTDYC